MYHYHREIGKRGNGKNAVFAAAYIRGEKKTCDRTGETKDFSNKNDVVYVNSFLPEDAPVWATALRHGVVVDSKGQKHEDTQGESFSTYAWNHIEFSEKRVDSQVYFHDDIALPNVLNQEQAIELVSEFAQNHLAINGLFCDVAIHWDENNHHFHVLLPMRTLTDTGFSKKIRCTQAQLSQEVKRIRKAWADAANQKLKTLGLHERIDHRSYKDRGIDLTPTVKIGKFTHFPDQAIAMRKIQENVLIRKTNSDAIQNNPAILAEKILQEHLFFDSNTVTDAINRHVLLEQMDVKDAPPPSVSDPVFECLLESIQTKEGIFNERALKKSVLEQVSSQAEFQRIYTKIIAHEQVFSLGLGEDGREHFVGRHAFDLENSLLKATHLLAAKTTFSVSKRLVAKVGLKFGLNESQQRALVHLTRSGNAAIVCGYAGTGKTYMLKAAKEVWEQSGFKMMGLATAGKAASGLEAETGIASKTICGFLQAVNSATLVMDEKTILVMDEMGMVSLDDMSAVMEIARLSGAKFAGVGDVEQTQPVGRGAPQRAMVDALGAVSLDTIIRQELAWQRQATLLLETNRTGEGFDLYAAQGCVHLHETQSQAFEETVNQWYASYSAQKDNDIKDFIMAAFKNETVNKLNVMARGRLCDEGILGSGVLVAAKAGGIHVAVGERLLFTRNAQGVGVRNGDFATVLHVSDDAKTVQVQCDTGAVVSINTDSYRHFTYGYAATVHKLQGHTTQECSVLVDGEGWDRHMFLVAATRHKSHLHIHAAHEHFVDLAHLKESVSRHGLNDILADFPVSFAQRRGFNLEHSASRATKLLQKGKARIFDAVSYLFNYQAAVEQGQSAYELSQAQIKARRHDAVLIAEFSDNRVELAVLLNHMEGIEGAEKEALQRTTYALQLRNGAIAARIMENPQHYAMALERNRIGDKRVKAAYDFYERDRFVTSLVKGQDRVSPTLAFQLLDTIKTYYGALCHHMPDEDVRRVFLRDMEQRADIHRRESAVQVFGLENRALVNAASRYKALDNEVGARLKELAHASSLDKQELYLAGVTRDRLAFELASSAHFEALTTHFGIRPERIHQHHEKYKDRMLVKAFSEQISSTISQGNLRKQAAAHQIKLEPKRYGIYVDEFLKDGWKSINLERWFYEKRKTIAKASPELKRSIQKVQRYKVAASGAYVQWQKAIERSKKESPHKIKNFKQAQGLSWKRSVLAHEIMGSLHEHVAALALEKVDTVKLYQQALHVDYLTRYRKATREPLKLHMAQYISANLKDFQAGLAVYGLYEEVKERAAHYEYLQRIKNADTHEIKTRIRLALDYQDKKVEAAKIWGQVKALKHLKIDARGLSLQAKHVMMQRNSAAFLLLQACTQQEGLSKDITGINLNMATLQRESSQHMAQNTIMQYLSQEPASRGELAKTLLANKAGYHLLYDNRISFATLNQEARQFEQARANQTSALLKEKAPQKNLWNIEHITHALMNNPIDTYTAILGEPKERTSNHLRYSGGLIVSTKGSNAGQWYSFTEEVGGTPVSAIQKYLNLSFPEALAYGASLAGLSDSEAKQASGVLRPVRQEPKPIHPELAHKITQGVTSAQSIWNGTEDAKGSLAERYFLEHRKLDTLEGMEIRYWPKGAIWVDFDATGAPIEKANKIPAAVIAARNAQGEVVSVQRIYLDAQTAGKNTFLKEPKLTKGSNKGYAGVIQTGVAGGILYLAEGPETAASIASLNREATVLVSFSVSNIANMAEVIKAYAPKQVVIAADNDGDGSASRKTTEKACHSLREKGIDVRIVAPDGMAHRDKVDWNDVLVEQGQDALTLQFQEKIAKNQFLFERAVPVVGTLGERYFKDLGSAVDLGDVRFLERIDFKGQSVPALLAPRTNAQGLLCGETVFALSQDGAQILGEGSKSRAREGFYVAQQGQREVLIIADTLFNAKAAARSHPDALVILARMEEHSKLLSALVAKEIKPSKVFVLSENHGRDQQLVISDSCQCMREYGAPLFLLDGRHGEITPIDSIALEKARLKMSFEQLLRQAPADRDALKQATPQERFDALKKERPVLEQYEHCARELKQVQGYAQEQLDKKLLSLAKEIAHDKKLLSVLQRDIPQVARDINKRILRAQQQGRGIHH
ncbi:MAG: AAA family ATPase [Legionella sp.]|nr:AAA family ATPase [Legionella sp.]